MSDGMEQLLTHLKSGATTTCRVWKVVRRDGVSYGFTDHDEDLSFDGTVFKANSGLTGGALQRSSGLAVDNTEVIGALSDDAISEVDLKSGRFDGAEVTTWLVNWNDVGQRMIRFRGHFGEVTLSSGEFRVELRGLTEPLNHPKGRIFQPGCDARLGDGRCRVDLKSPDKFAEATIAEVRENRTYLIFPLVDKPIGVFEQGFAEVVSGEAIGMQAGISLDTESGDFRRISLNVNFNLQPMAGDRIKLTVGCDKSMETCRTKFANLANFRGFPHIPGADWMAAYPVASLVKDGGSRYK